METASVTEKTTSVPAGPCSSFAGFVEKLQRYWFLVTVVASLMGSIFYMVVFQVTPWAAYSEAKQRRQLVALYDRIGYGMLERGQYQPAKMQFERALKVKDTDHAASAGSYMADLFMDAESPDPDVATSLAVVQNLSDLSGDKSTTNFTSIVEKCLGDAYRLRRDYTTAQQHYEKSIALKADYLDALDAYGWLSYSELPDLTRMQQLFATMTKVDDGDYRGFHGLGLALYMQATKESEPGHRRQLIVEAAQQSQKAMQLKVVYINVLVDFGEIARSYDPDTAIALHEQANQFLDDPELNALPINKGAFGTQLLTDEDYIVIGSANEKRAWIFYQLALDHLARCRLGVTHCKGDLAQHTDLFKKALRLDPVRQILPVYKDQRRVLDILLSNEVRAVSSQ